MNNKGQTPIGLVILGVVTITAVIGLVLLFTRGSADGAAVIWREPQTSVVAPLRTPAFVIAGESANFLARSDCEKSIKLAGVLSTPNTFDCYSLPYRASSSISSEQVSVGCYSNQIAANSNDGAVRNEIINSLETIRLNSHPDITWDTTMMNGERLAVCVVSGRPT
ncbi:hypothetical protein J4211_03555 [Candidatus Woesearchaeota archaeon]|nr:hypothetical protein [Candidatus Woesearchaeota archaeon]